MKYNTDFSGEKKKDKKRQLEYVQVSKSAPKI